jgi:pimeloyl-ACP methyl ester carboxylesterase
MIDELRSLLAQAGARPPYILVGHSFGGLLIRAFAALYPQEVAGLVLVDPVSIQAWANCPESGLERLRRGIKLANRGAWAARFGLVRAALMALVAGRRWFPKLAARVGGRQGTAAVTNLIGEVRKLPPEVWPLVRSHWSNPKCFRAMAEYLQCLPECARCAEQMPVKGVPTIILSAANAKPEEVREREEWIRQNGEGKHIEVAESGHWLHLEQPHQVVIAVQELVQHARERRVHAFSFSESDELDGACQLMPTHRPEVPGTPAQELRLEDLSASRPNWVNPLAPVW